MAEDPRCNMWVQRRDRVHPGEAQILRTMFGFCGAISVDGRAGGLKLRAVDDVGSPGPNASASGIQDSQELCVL